MAKNKSKSTKQGVRDLNGLGGKRLNGKRKACTHYMDDVSVIDNYFDLEGNVVDILACDGCGETLNEESCSFGKLRQ